MRRDLVLGLALGWLVFLSGVALGLTYEREMHLLEMERAHLRSRLHLLRSYGDRIHEVNDSNRRLMARACHLIWSAPVLQDPWSPQVCETLLGCMDEEPD